MLYEKPQLFKRLASTALACCVAVATAAWPAIDVQAATQDFTTPEGIAANDMGHYNGILFGDWAAYQADIEGAIAVAGSVNLPNDFSIAANGDKMVIGDYDPTSKGYPTALLGARAGQNTITIGNVQATGHLVLRESAQSAFSAEVDRIGSRSGVHYVNDSLIDGFFDKAWANTSDLVDLFGAALPTASMGSEYLSQVWNQYKMSGLGPYKVDLDGLAADKVLLIPIYGSEITWQTPVFTSEMEGYDLVVFYFPEAQQVNYAGSLTYYLDNTENGVFVNSSAGRDQNAAWAARIVMVYPEATNINFSSKNAGGASSIGSIIAPNAAVEAYGGSHNGMLIADSLTQWDGFELHAFWTSPYISKELDKDPDPRPDPEPGTALFTKQDAESGKGLEGAVFLLETEDENGAWQPVQSYTTGENGALSLENLMPGRYRLTETAAPEGYELNPEPIVFTMEWDGEKTQQKDGENGIIKNDLISEPDPDPEPGAALFTKQDGESGKGLEGAVFLLETEDENGAWQPVQSYTTGENGTLRLENLMPGRYRLTETAAPEGYELNPEPIVFTMEWDGEKTQQKDGVNGIIKNDLLAEPDPDPEPGAALFTKQDGESGKGLEGAVFLLETEDENGAWQPVGSYTSGEGGTLRLENLMPGHYRLTETAAPEGYELNPAPRYFTMDWNGEATVQSNPGANTIPNQPEEKEPGPEPEVGLRVEKRDADSGEALPGARFNLYAEVFAPEPVDAVLPDGPDAGESEAAQPISAMAQSFGHSAVRLLSAAGAEPNTAGPQDTAPATEPIEAPNPEADPPSTETDGSEAEEADASAQPEDGNATQAETQPATEPDTLAPEAAGEPAEAPAIPETPADTNTASAPETGPLPEREAATADAPEAASEEDAEESGQDWYDLAYQGRYWKLVGEELTSDADGLVYATDTAPATAFLLEETGAPEGYQLPDGEARFTLLEYNGEEALTAVIENTADTPVDPDPAPDPGVALFWKIDAETSDGVPDAQFRLEIYDEEAAASGADGWTVLRDDIPSTSEGRIEIGGLLPGYYRLIEEIAPDGYLLDPTPKYFTMHAQGDETLQMDPDENLIENQPEEPDEPGPGPKPEPVYGQIRITKCDFDDNDILLPGTTFTLHKYTLEDTAAGQADVLPLAAGDEGPAFLYDEENWAPYPDEASHIHVTNDGGEIVVTGLVAGTYRVEEIEPPDGYDLWGDGIDVIHFVMAETTDIYGNPVLVVDAIYNNHLEVDDEIVFADRQVTVPETSTSSEPQTTTSNPAGGGETTSSEPGITSDTTTTSGGRVAESTESGGSSTSGASGYSSSTASGSASASARTGATYRGTTGGTGGSGSSGGSAGGSTNSGGSGAKTASPVKTGDSGSAWAFLAIGLVALAAVVALVGKRQRGQRR